MRFVYAQLDERDYCIGVSELNGEVNQNNMILIEEYDSSYVGRKYDSQNKKWTDEYLQAPEKPLTITLEDIKVDTSLISENVETTSFDNLINMDMLLAIDEKLNVIMEHLGL